MKGIRFYVLACVLATASGFVAVEAPGPPAGVFPGWPAQFEGRALRELPLSLDEQRFNAGFPGRTGRFSDGSREVIVRWVLQPTRTLHPSADCFRGHGYVVDAGPLWIDLEGRTWSTFGACRGDRRLRIRELLVDEGGRNWADVSAWYWAARLGETEGPWWVYTVAQGSPTSP